MNIDFKLIPQVNFNVSSISGSDSKFLRFDLSFEDQSCSFIRIGKKIATQDRHSDIWIAFVHEMCEAFSVDEDTVARLLFNKKCYGGGRLQRQTNFVSICDSSAEYGKESNRELTKEILEKNLNYNFFINTLY
jgi:hypothetical protein